MTARAAPVLPTAALEARQGALQLLEAALARRGGLEDALSTPRFMALSAQDRGFARAVVMATLRRLGPIDRILDAKLKKEPPPRVRQLLRLGLAQAFWLDTPEFAAVDTTVALTPQALRGLVNAVLRGALRDGKPPEESETLAPPWLMARWRAAYGADDALAIATEIAKEPATDLTARDPADREALAALLEGEVLSGGGIRLRGRGDVAEWPGFAEGRWWVQDAASAIPARLAPREAATALDMCAAPGGKTFQLAAAGLKVTALDKSAARLRRLDQGLARIGLTAEGIAADAAAWGEGRIFEVVLLDAPCSSTGAFRRHPDVLWNARPGDIASLATSQTRLLAAAAARVKPGGALIYSVCSLEPEEGEGQVRGFLERHPAFSLDRLAPGEGGAPARSLTPEGWLRVLPHHLGGGIDGFFVARMTKAV